jgi:putative membrane protein
MWLQVGKPPAFYTENGLFHVKLTLFVLSSLVSIYPTLFFLKHRKNRSTSPIAIPKKVFMAIRVELLLITILPLLAVLVARGKTSF